MQNTEKELKRTPQQLINDLTDGTTPKYLMETLTKLYVAYAHTDNADCSFERTQVTNVFGNLIQFFGGLDREKP